MTPACLQSLLAETEGNVRMVTRCLSKGATLARSPRTMRQFRARPGGHLRGLVATCHLANEAPIPWPLRSRSARMLCAQPPFARTAPPTSEAGPPTGKNSVSPPQPLPPTLATSSLLSAGRQPALSFLSVSRWLPHPPFPSPSTGPRVCSCAMSLAMRQRLRTGYGEDCS